MLRWTQETKAENNNYINKTRCIDSYKTWNLCYFFFKLFLSI